MMWPDWVTSFEDMPVDLLRAINHAGKILDWYENLMEDEVPPEWMWAFDEPLEEWFKELKEARKNPQDKPDPNEDALMMTNELTSDRGRFS